MPRTRLALAALLFGTTLFGACGGRSGLRTAGYDGGEETDGGSKLDGKRDGVPGIDGGQPGDTLADAPVTDAPLFPDVRGTDLAATDSLADGSKLDVATDTRPGPDGVDAGGADVIRLDGSIGRDAIDAISDGPAALSGIELSPVNPTIVSGVPYTSLVVTALFSDGTTTDVTSSATFSSSDTTVVQISGHTLTGQKAGSATVTATYSGKTATTKITVSSAKLTSISIDGTTVVSVGQSILVSATGVFADGTKQDLTAAATWTSSSTSLATVALDSASAKEKVAGVKAGSATISAAYQGITGTATITITASPITTIAITPVQPVLQKGVSKEFQATATYADGTTSDVTAQAAWTISDATIASVTASATGVVVRALAAGTATLTATVGTIKGSTTITVTTPTLVSMALTPSTWSPNVGSTQSFTATGTYSDASTADLTLSAAWSSTAATTVAISNTAGQKGQATALAVGTAQVQAALLGVTGSATVTVSASPLVSIAVTPDPVAIVLGLTSSLVATATYQNGTTQVVTTQVAWAIADGTVASVSNAAATAGQVKGLTAGTTTVTATLSGKSGSAPVTVSQATLTTIAVSPASATITAGTSQAFTATGSYNSGATVDLTTQVTWSSGDTTVAQTSNASASKGLTTGLVAGTATITATLGAVSGTATLTVGAPLLSSVSLSPSSATVTVGKTQAFTVTAVYDNGTTGQVQGATWASSNTAVATIRTQGPQTIATGVAAGTTTITVTYQGKSDTATLTVTAATTLLEIRVSPQSPPSLLVGATQQFQATAIYSDGSTTDVTNAVSWTTSNATVASISNGGNPGPGGGGGGGRGNAGTATGVGAGTATITASYDGTCTGSCTATATLTVRDPVATGMTITPISASVRVGATQQFTAVLVYDDGTSRTQTTGVSWTTSNGAIASISSAGAGGPGPGGGGGNGGLATGIGAGTATITATYDTFTATATLTVTAATPKALVVTPAATSAVVGATQAYVATLVYDDGTTSVVTGADWTSSDASVATVSTGGPGGGPGGGGPGNGGGTATALSVGTSTITATYSGLSGSATLTVTDPPISYIQVTPTNTNLPVGATQPFTATAVFADFTTRNVTASAAWTSSNTSAAVVTGTGPNAGRASALAEGSATITATYDGVSGSTVLTVAKTVVSVSVTPANPTTVLGVGVAFSATATLSNNATLVVTSAAAWVSSDVGVATVTAGGAATPVKAGSSTITATYLGVSGTSKLTVSSATLSSITLAPSPLSLARNGSQQLTATGLYSDASSHDLSAVATWLSSTATVASVSNASGSRGLLTALASGTTNVTAVFQGVTSTADAVTVTP